MTFKRLYFVRDATVTWLGVMVALQTCTLYADMTLIRSRVKVKVTGRLKFRKLAKPCIHAGGDDRQPPSGAFWLVVGRPHGMCRYLN